MFLWARENVFIKTLPSRCHRQTAYQPHNEWEIKNQQIINILQSLYVCYGDKGAYLLFNIRYPSNTWRLRENKKLERGFRKATGKFISIKFHSAVNVDAKFSHDCIIVVMDFLSTSSPYVCTFMSSRRESSPQQKKRERKKTFFQFILLFNIWKNHFKTSKTFVRIAYCILYVVISTF